MTSTEPFAGAVRIDVSLASPQQAVWETITDSSRLSEWLGGPVEIDPVVGGRIRFELPDDGVVASGVVRDVQPPRPGMAVALLVHTFVDARSPDAVSECRWSVVDAGDGTSELHFTHDGFGEIPPSSVWGGRLGRRTPIGQAKASLSAARSILLVSFIGDEVPQTLMGAGFDVFAKTGPGPQDWAHGSLAADGSVEWAPQSAPPDHVDLVHLDWMPAFGEYLDVAASLGAETYWVHSGRTRPPEPADSRGCWLPAPQSEEQRRLTEARGLTYIDDHYIADVARQLDG